jgi:hypothetical protein
MNSGTVGYGPDLALDFVSEQEVREVLRVHEPSIWPDQDSTLT